jgi:hypothetical protein
MKDDIKIISSLSSFINRVNCIHEHWKAHELTVLGSNDPAVTPWFRGQGDASHRLVPSLVYMSKADEYFDEFWINEQFRKRASLHNDLKIRNDEKDLWLFQSRHHGAPSRLLDWTESALTALFFCVENLSQSDGMVYMMQPFLWNQALGYGSYSVPECNMSIETVKFYVDLAYTQEPHKHINYTDTQLQRFALAIRPPLMTPRLVAQRGVFTIHGTDLSITNSETDNGIIADLNDQARVLSEKIDDCRKNDLLASIRIDGSSKKAIQSELALMGITRATLFPDMDGLVQELKFRFVKSIG